MSFLRRKLQSFSILNLRFAKTCQEARQEAEAAPLQRSRTTEGVPSCKRRLQPLHRTVAGRGAKAGAFAYVRQPFALFFSFFAGQSGYFRCRKRRRIEDESKLRNLGLLNARPSRIPIMCYSEILRVSFRK